MEAETLIQLAQAEEAGEAMEGAAEATAEAVPAAMDAGFSTNITSFSDPWAIGALYPGPGFEWLMVIVVFALWGLWHLWQMSSENKEYSEALRLYKEVGMERAMLHATGRIATEEELKAHEVQAALGRRVGH